MSSISIDDITAYVQRTYPGVVARTNWGERALFYDPDGRLPLGIYVLSFKENDGPHDHVSKLDREGVFRLNLGVTRETFTDLFGPIPARPRAGAIIEAEYDFAALDTIMPHPVYGWMTWICVLNPGLQTFERLKPLIRQSVALAEEKYSRKFRSLRSDRARHARF